MTMIHDNALPSRADIFSALLYYDIFGYPLTAAEVHAFLPAAPATLRETLDVLDAAVLRGELHTLGGYYAVDERITALVGRRRDMERYARRHWRVARIMTQVIKRFPFVSAVFITGTLSKNISAPELDIDYFIVTAPGRLWIARTLLIAFKKFFLFNSKKYFCLNYFVSEDALAIPERNVFTATEITHVKALHNAPMLRRFLDANPWISDVFPNWSPAVHPTVKANDRRSVLARILAIPFRSSFADRLDDALMARWARVWIARYPELPEAKRNALFQVSKTASKAHGPDFQTRILAAHAERCRAYGLVPPDAIRTFPATPGIRSGEREPQLREPVVPDVYAFDADPPLVGIA
ncbi:MAG: hypothetical protein IPP94_12965 [Ignavibacteria bacterium]|nr:hypothetical protein [Ignavibacteria bacterium]